MNREEVQKILTIIAAAYPNFKPADKTSTINSWSFFLEDYSYQDISMALKTYVRSGEGRGFAPSVDQLIGILAKTEQMEEKTEGEAWAIVSRAIGNAIYHSEDEFEAFPQEIQRAVGSANQLKEWAMDSDFNESVISSNFMRSYRAITEKKKHYDALPAEARGMIEQRRGAIE